MMPQNVIKMWDISFQSENGTFHHWSTSVSCQSYKLLSTEITAIRVTWHRHYCEILINKLLKLKEFNRHREKTRLLFKNDDSSRVVWLLIVNVEFTLSLWQSTDYWRQKANIAPLLFSTLQFTANNVLYDFSYHKPRKNTNKLKYLKKNVRWLEAQFVLLSNMWKQQNVAHLPF